MLDDMDNPMYSVGPMDTPLAKSALRAHAEGKKLSQAVIRELYLAGYIEIRKVTHTESLVEEILATLITEKGKHLLKA
jgi:hypothetical protein